MVWKKLLLGGVTLFTAYSLLASDVSARQVLIRRAGEKKEQTVVQEEKEKKIIEVEEPKKESPILIFPLGPVDKEEKREREKNDVEKKVQKKVQKRRERPLGKLEPVAPMGPLLGGIGYEYTNFNSSKGNFNSDSYALLLHYDINDKLSVGGGAEALNVEATDKYMSFGLGGGMDYGSFSLFYQHIGRDPFVNAIRGKDVSSNMLSSSLALGEEKGDVTAVGSLDAYFADSDVVLDAKGGAGIIDFAENLDIAAGVQFLKDGIFDENYGALNLGFSYGSGTFEEGGEYRLKFGATASIGQMNGIGISAGYRFTDNLSVVGSFSYCDYSGKADRSETKGVVVLGFSN